MSTTDLERGGEYKPLNQTDTAEDEALLPESAGVSHEKDDGEAYRAPAPTPTLYVRAMSPRYALWHLVLAFVAGILGCMLIESLFNTWCPSKNSPPAEDDAVRIAAPSHVGSTEVHNFPPASPTNEVTSLFPSNVGYAGITPTGAEPGVVATAPAYPVHTGAPALLTPSIKGGAKGSKGGGFDMFKYWGNLSPWYSVDRGTFGLDSAPEAPEGCSVTGLHFLHRHGARYPTAWTSYGGPAKFATQLHDSAGQWSATGDLAFLNDWTYKLGEEVLTPFGRQQLFDMGVSLRLKYGFLLKNFTESNTIPVFRTESQDRMLHSALNFAMGFFGLPLEGKYLQSITIEEDGYNNTLAPYKTCLNAKIPSKADRGTQYVRDWSAIYLVDAQARLQAQIEGFNMTIENVYTLQQTCAYETVAIGFSKFCELFTEEEWEGFEYALDLYFWYDSAFGSPVARVQGLGWIQELVARLTNTPIATHNSSTNATLDDNSITFPLGQSLYVDATHEVVVLNVIAALNLSNFAVDGPLPPDHIPANRSFVASQLAPFGTNIQFQLLSCSNVADPQIRIVINDGVVPLTGIRGCPTQKDGMCPVDEFVSAQKQIIAETDWEYDCFGDWTVPPGTAWNTTTGDSPKFR